MAKLYFYYSAMNAGKTTLLLQSAHNYRERGMHPLLFTPALDDRYKVGLIRSRIGLESEAVAFSREDDLFECVQEHLSKQNVHCALVDEAQFLTRDQVFQLTELVDRLNIPVLCFGLRTDFQGELFEGSRYLLAWADQLEELKTICHTGKKATMVVRVDEQGYAMREGSQVEIGGNERYVSVSRKEFKNVFYAGKQVRLIDPLAAHEEEAPKNRKNSGVRVKGQSKLLCPFTLTPALRGFMTPALPALTLAAHEHHVRALVAKFLGGKAQQVGILKSRIAEFPEKVYAKFVVAEHTAV